MHVDVVVQPASLATTIMETAAGNRTCLSACCWRLGTNNSIYEGQQVNTRLMPNEVSGRQRALLEPGSFPEQLPCRRGNRQRHRLLISKAFSIDMSLGIFKLWVLAHRSFYPILHQVEGVCSGHGSDSDGGFTPSCLILNREA